MSDSSRLLLDTHIFLWWLTDPENLKQSSHQVIHDAETVMVSVASAWELEIKASLGRLSIPASVEQAVVESGFEPLAIFFRHTEELRRLPQHHRDPFDRILICQAICEDLTLVTRDQKISKYEVSFLKA